jgi:hypothetical protein
MAKKRREIENLIWRFENLVALHPLKAVRLRKAMGEGEVHLNFIRDKEKRGADFQISDLP